MDDLYAFDYETQKWMTGEAARKLLIAQNRQTLELLCSDKGAGYAKLMGASKEQMISDTNKELARLTA